MTSPCRSILLRCLLAMAIPSACAPAISSDPKPQEMVAPDPRVAWLAAHAIPLRSISPADTSVADLQPLKQVIGDARIVMLGEASHGDGAGILARTRIIRFLHQELGFDVLAFESSMYNCAAADRMLHTGSDALTAVQACAYRIWSDAQEIVPLAEYLSGTAQTSRPLHLAGFDNAINLTGPEHTPQSFITELRAFLLHIGQADAWPADDPGFEPLLRNVLAFAFYTDTTLVQPDSALYEDFVATLEQMSLHIRSTAAEEERSRKPGAADPNWMESSRWVRLLEGLVVLARQQPWTQRSDADVWAAINRRDVQMARNLLWLVKVPFAGRKLILWGHNGHFMRNLRQLDAADGSFNYRDEGAMVPMGQHLWEVLGEDTYMLAITSYEGSAAPPFPNDVSVSIIPDITRDQDPSLELEELLAATGIESAIVDLRKLSREHWLRKSLVARPLEYTAMRAEDWGESVDGFLFIRTMAPATPLQR
jgi:erythromycin esterase